MNGNPQSEQLSAYFDNQLPLDERALVEQELASSAEMRKELEEYRQVSGILQSLPRTSAPIELRTSVLRAIERESLLPVADTARPRRLGRLVTAVSAACALAAIGFFAMQNRNGQQIANNNAAPGPAIVQGQRGGSENLANKIQQDRLEFDRDALKTAAVGDLVKAVVTDGKSLSVIRLTVIGRDDGLNQLGLLLAGSEVRNGQKSDGDGGVMAVYLQADSAEFFDKLSQVLAKLDVDSLSVSEPVAFDKLDADQQKLVSEATEKVATIAVKPGSALEQAVKGSAATKTADAKSGSGPARVLFVLTNKS